MKALNPDGVVVSADYSQAVTVIREMKRQGMIKTRRRIDPIDIVGDP